MKLFEVTTQKISVDEVVSRVVSPEIGAVVTFVGTVRGITGERETRYLKYDAYPEMAEETLRQIGDEILKRWADMARVAIVHRIGNQEVGEISVVIAVASSHRQHAFDAASYAIERIKEIVPIWKKEVYADGEEWVEGTHYESRNTND